MEYVIEMWGRIPSKKGHYRSKPGGRGIFIDSVTKTELDRLALQIPGQFRGLSLENPTIDVWFTLPSKSRHADRDSKWTTLSDILVNYKVMREDDCFHGNGLIRIHPATIGSDHFTKIKLTVCQARST